MDVLGIGISVVDLAGAVQETSRFIAEKERRYICVTGVHGVMESQHDPALAEIHNLSGLTTPDGMPMVWAGRWAGAAGISRVYGPELMLALCQVGVEKGWRHFFYGGDAGVAHELATRLMTKFPGLEVAGTYTPPFRTLTKSEAEEVTHKVNQAKPDLVWVGLSTPKQERWMAHFRPALEAAVLVGVGAAFDIHAGRSRQAPRWMQRSGLEWLYRLGKEPRRLWKRYLRNNPAFLWKIIRRPPFLRHS